MFLAGFSNLGPVRFFFSLYVVADRQRGVPVSQVTLRPRHRAGRHLGLRRRGPELDPLGPGNEPPCGVYGLRRDGLRQPPQPGDPDAPVEAAWPRGQAFQHVSSVVAGQRAKRHTGLIVGGQSVVRFGPCPGTPLQPGPSRWAWTAIRRPLYPAAECSSAGTTATSYAVMGGGNIGAAECSSAGTTATSYAVMGGGNIGGLGKLCRLSVPGEKCARILRGRASPLPHCSR